MPTLAIFLNWLQTEHDFQCLTGHTMHHGCAYKIFKILDKAGNKIHTIVGIPLEQELSEVQLAFYERTLNVSYSRK